MSVQLEEFNPEGVYVSASSSEIVRAKKWMAALREKGIKVTSTWPEEIEKAGGNANPRDASLEDRQKWSRNDIRECIGSQILWLLLPPKPSFGATFEFAFFLALADQERQGCVVSGDHLSTIFTSLVPCFDADEAAFAEIVSAFEDMKNHAEIVSTFEDMKNQAKPKSATPPGEPSGV